VLLIWRQCPAVTGRAGLLLSVMGLVFLVCAGLLIGDRLTCRVQEQHQLLNRGGIIFRVFYASLLADQGSPADAAAVFEEIADDYAGTDTGAEALSWAGGMWEAAGDYKMAAAAYERLVAEYPKSSRRSGAELRLRSMKNSRRRKVPLAEDTVAAEFAAAATLEKHGEYETAAQAYEALARAHPGHELAPFALLSAGHSYFLAGRLEYAKRRWAEVLQKYPESAFSADANFALRAATDPARLSALRDALLLGRAH